MLIRYLRGPNKGKTGHLPSTQEIAALIALGDLEIVDPREAAELDAPKPGELSRHHTIPPVPKKGYSIQRFGPAAIPCICFADGCGGVMRWEPGKYPADLPEALKQEFLRLQPAWSEAQAEGQLQRKLKLEAELLQQNALTQR